MSEGFGDEFEDARSQAPPDELEYELGQLKVHHISDKTRRIYQGQQVMFIQFLANHQSSFHYELIPEHIRANIRQQPLNISRSYILALLKPPVQKSNAPIHFPSLTHEHVMAFILAQKKSNEHTLSNSSLRSRRSAILNLFEEFDQKRSINPKLAQDLPLYFKSYQKERAQLKSQGEESLKEGKDPLSFSNYAWIAENMLTSGIREHTFAHCLLTLTWNLICRVNNSITVNAQHVSWSEDSLVIQFAFTKTDQTGELSNQIRHVYANPVCPEICPVLSLAIYLSCFRLEADGAIFPGAHQYGRFSAILRRFLNSESILPVALSRGIIPKDLGTHSLRKGASTYVSNGTTAAASQSSVSHRAGWSQGGVRDRYIHFADAGDCYLGRLVSGLPSLSPLFASLPPFFTDPHGDMVRDAVRVCFPGAYSCVSLQQVLPFLLASLVFHFDFLKKKLHGKHPLLSTPLFSCNDLIARLRGSGKFVHIYNVIFILHMKL
jgi:hypothetical protein